MYAKEKQRSASSSVFHYDIISITKSGLNAITDHYKMVTFLLQLNEIQMVAGVPNQI